MIKLFIFGAIFAISAPVQVYKVDESSPIDSSSLAVLPESVQTLTNNLKSSDPTSLSSLSSGDTSLKSTKLATDKNGNSHNRIQQLYENIPVWPAGIIVHQSSQQGLAKGSSTVTGIYVEGLKEDLGSINVDAFNEKLGLEKLEVMKKKHKDDKFSTDSEKSVKTSSEHTQLIIYVGQNFSGIAEAKKAYLIDFFMTSDGQNKASGQPSRPYFIVDADTGEIIHQWEGLTTQIEGGTIEQIGRGYGGNSETKKYHYGTDYPLLTVTVDARRKKCYLVNENVLTVNNMGSQSQDKTTPHKFKCPNQKKRRINGAFSPLNDAHAFGQVVFDMYQSWYGTKPLLQQLQLKAHFGRRYENAFWDGTAMYFGDGFSYFYPLTGLDIVAHEVSHGVTQQNSNLAYYGQSGGINEAFSDMAGKAAEFFFNGQVTDWGIGQLITKSQYPLRYMDVPENDGRSIGHVSQYYDGIDVHYSSGVFNKVFYHLATTDGWDVKRAFDVFYTANVAYWSYYTDFLGGAEGAYYACEGLGYDTQALMDAFGQVGIIFS